MMRQMILSIMIFVTFISMETVLAQGIYLGAGIGSTFYSSEVMDAESQLKAITENSVAWKLFGGYRITDFLNIEGGYRSYEGISSSLGTDVYKSKTTGWDLEGLGRLQLLIFDVFVKAGMVFWSTDISFLGDDTSESGSDFLWGLGAGAHLGPLGVRLEWESIAKSGPTSLSMLSLGATLGF